MIGSEPIIECRELSCGYGEAAVVSNVNLEVTRGEMIAIVGPSGSGKSTLLRTLLGILPPLEGEVRLLGQDPYALNREAREKLWRRVGILFQSDALLSSQTVLDNVALPLLQLTDYPAALAIEMARSRLELMGVGGLESRLPSEVSGGERRRVALARAVIVDPEILFCDEPTGGLDPVAAVLLERLLRKLRDSLGTTVVVVTHEMRTVKAISDRVVMVCDGGVYAVGSFDELRQSTDPCVRAFIHGDLPEVAA